MTTRTRKHPDNIRRMARPKMIQKTYRVSERLYEAAMAKAEEREEALSDIIRAALERYVHDED
jgi:predicted HicB family RNase H-like nuclease